MANNLSKMPVKLNIQHSVFNDGCFVLHSVEFNGQKYSAWFGRDGVLFSAELVLRNGTTRNVPERQTQVRAKLNSIGKRYVGVK